MPSEEGMATVLMDTELELSFLVLPTEVVVIMGVAVEDMGVVVVTITTAGRVLVGVAIDQGGINFS